MNAILLAWIATTMFDRPPVEVAMPPGIEVRRSDIGTLAIDRSNWGTPLRIGARVYARGLGTHCVSELVVRLPKAGRAFEAEVGLDSDPTILGRGGVVAYTVEVAGREAFRSGECRRGDTAVPVRVDLQGQREFVLKVLEVERGYNHANWVNPTATLEDGQPVAIESLPVIRRPELARALPFSFDYGGRTSRELLPEWSRTVTAIATGPDKERYAVRFHDPETRLTVTCDLTLFKEDEAVDWVLFFENEGKQNTPVLANIEALDVGLRVPVGNRVSLHTLRGSSASERDFLPVHEAVSPGESRVLSPAGGLSSGGAWQDQTDGRMPFFNLAWSGGGMVGAIGWSGQWELRVARDAAIRSPLEDKQPRSEAEERRLRAHVMAEREIRRDRDLTIAAGQQTSHFTLYPGERVRSPRVLLALWDGEQPTAGYNRLRRLLLKHYVPRRDGEVLLPPVSALAIRYGQDFESTNEANQLDAIPRMARLGVEAYWHDTAWFVGGFPTGIGNWTVKPEAFPNGLRPLGDAARAEGMDFVLWFDFERVVAGTEIAREHPEWLLHAGAGDALYDLGDPAAFEWLLDRVSRCIEDWGVTVLRQDCTLRPLAYWQAADAPDRQGIAEIRHVENLYALWDALRERFPDLDIDNCAGGGCRLDLETSSRSWPLWRSDTQIFGKAYPEWNQAQTAGLSLCVPLHAAGVWAYDPYRARSAFTMGSAILADVRHPEFPAEAVRRSIEEVKRLRRYWLGDYYPLTEIDVDERHWCGWQLHRPDLQSGYFVLFRRSRSLFPVMEVTLQGLHPAADYAVTSMDREEPRTLSGSELECLRVEIDVPGSSALYEYTRERGGG